MTIRWAILRAFLGLVAGTILLSGALSFYEFRGSLQAEIGLNLRASAQALVGRLDAFLSERLEDLREWRRLELLEDIRVGDVDKRLARLLADLKAGHGTVYGRVFCTDLDGRVIASSDNAQVGTVVPPAPTTDAERTGVTLAPAPAFGPGTIDRLMLRTGITSAISGQPLGWLYAEVQGAEIRGLLAGAVEGSTRTAFLAGDHGQVIAAAGPLAGATVLAQVEGSDEPGGGPADPSADGLLVGRGDPSGYRHVADMGWHLHIVEPEYTAFAPVRGLAWTILAALAATLVLAGWFAARLSARIASPIGQLTDFARELDLARVPTAPHIDTPMAEVRELSRAFGDMLAALSRSREHLIRAGKLAVVGEMAAIMAHEVRTPLGILKSSAQMLERRTDLSPRDRELTAFIGTETERLNRLVTTLLEAASPRAPQRLPEDLHAVLDHVAALVEAKLRKGDLTLTIHRGAADPVIACDREQIIQVFLNLVLNAIQHLRPGGRIAIFTADVGGAIEAWVEDDGPGIAEAELERCFDPFFTRREGGIGLGLTIVRQIVEAHDGRISAARGRSGGACFTICLPRTTGDRAP
ncbi:MAG: hypothetical protein LJE69_18075 [Thiohalocapsa sp.]|uniref:sensor histidine kinase n=1 Tax=Thiohalocapsa sp. TaxID=2497641 RepID=UPI0025EB952D|nr:ATP-binding protein [Thiohalocapsa sp.]MCG6943143.1 hypothetical protein [Thiohalocapsa sp.]